ncbi:MAG: hypothetical protein IT165_37955 [Bryobacterales bacterium]|nr:hypothetical protein [Bryobacterales bacterium]
MRLILVSASVLLAGCGYVGDPRPPALNIPKRIEDLNAIQHGASLRLTFTLPKMTTEDLLIREQGELDVRVGVPGGGEFNVDAWAPAARRVPASAASASQDGGMVVEAPVGDFAGKEVFAAVRTANPKGRWSGWSNVLAVQVVKPLEVPANVSAEAVAEGVRLSWKGDGQTSYRVYRQGEDDKTFAQIGQAQGSSFIDKTAQFGKSYRYRVQAVQKVGEREAESDLSATKEIKPVDTFAPAVPAGLTVLSGVSSVELAWERNLDKDLRGYQVYRATGDGPMERIASLVESPAYSDKTVEAGKTYHYAVSAVDQAGNESARPEPVTITFQP